MAEPLTLALDADRLAPGAVVAGEVHWQRDHAPTAGTLRLCWDTAGKGDPDRAVVQVVDLATMPRIGATAGGHPFRGGDDASPTPPLAARDARRFQLQLPDEPYSFVGTLIELTWSIEVEVDGEAVRRTLIVAPGDAPVAL